MEYKVGDTVIVTGHNDGITFTGQVGVIKVIEGFTPPYGIDFSGSMPAEFLSLHDLDGELEDDTGYWVYEYNMKPATKRKTGFGMFIQKIEG